ncbi:MAG: hypothetical protein IPI78_10630 [Chitinophagaceae bacterium]|nr:hypothetical protein [Chitinophagaceae bacterium]
MKKIILSALVVSMALAVNAQQIPERKTDKPEMRHKMDRNKGSRMDMQKLNLTEDQKAQFKTQRESFRKQMEDLKKNENITVKEQKEKMAAIQKENKAKMQSFLTADQKAQIEKNKVEGKKKFEARTKERGEKMKTQLGLTDAQSAQLKKNREATQQKMKAIKEDSKMSEEQKRTQMKELMKAQQESMKSVLTEYQLKKMKESQHRQPGNRGGDRKKPVKNNDTI